MSGLWQLTGGLRGLVSSFAYELVANNHSSDPSELTQ